MLMIRIGSGRNRRTMMQVTIAAMAIGMLAQCGYRDTKFLATFDLPKGLDKPKTEEVLIPKDAQKGCLALAVKDVTFAPALKRSQIKVRLTWENKGSTPMQVGRNYRETIGVNATAVNPYLQPGEKYVAYEGTLIEIGAITSGNGFLTVMKAESLQANLIVEMTPEEPVRDDLKLDFKCWFFTPPPL